MLLTCFSVTAGALVLAAAQTDDRSLALGIINQARAGQGIQALAWNSDLAAYANYWATQMATGAVGFQHASGQYRPQQGETLFESQSSRCDTEYDYPLQNAANSWLSEGAQWNGQPVNTGSEPWLHWSQCMWSQTTQIGCARAFSTSTPYQVYSVCRFYPEGNMHVFGLPYLEPTLTCPRIGLSPY